MTAPHNIVVNLGPLTLDNVGGVVDAAPGMAGRVIPATDVGVCIMEQVTALLRAHGAGEVRVVVRLTPHAANPVLSPTPAPPVPASPNSVPATLDLTPVESGPCRRVYLTCMGRLGGQRKIQRQSIEAGRLIAGAGPLPPTQADIDAILALIREAADKAGGLRDVSDARLRIDVAEVDIIDRHRGSRVFRWDPHSPYNLSLPVTL